MLDMEFCAPYPGGFPGELNSSELRPGDIYIIGPDTARLLTNRTYLTEEPRRYGPAWGSKSFQFG